MSHAHVSANELVEKMVLCLLKDGKQERNIADSGFHIVSAAFNWRHYHHHECMMACHIDIVLRYELKPSSSPQVGLIFRLEYRSLPHLYDYIGTSTMVSNVELENLSI